VALSGVVVDGGGAPVSGVNLDVVDVTTGTNHALFGDNTDAAGAFAFAVPAGTYDITLTPPSPPTTTLLTVDLLGVTLAADTDLGTIALATGVILTGHVQDSFGSPVENVDLDLVDELAGTRPTLPGDKTDANGDFQVVVPTNDIELRFDATTVAGATLASTALELSPTAAMDVGTIVLPPGFPITGIVRDTGGAPVVGADLDIRLPATGDKIYTPGDNTDGSGAFSVVVPAGTWHVEVCPDFTDLLAGFRVTGVSVTSATSLGVLVAQPGVVLSGAIRAFDGTPQPGADVDLFTAGTETEAVLCGDDADAAGNYAVVVPLGVFDIVYTADAALPLGRDIRAGVSISGPTTLDGSLPSCPFSTNYSVGLAGSGGLVPHITSVGGAPRGGNDDWGYSLQNAVGGAPGLLFIGLGSTSIPFRGGLLLVNPLGPMWSFSVQMGGAFGVPGAGSSTFVLPVPIERALVGLTLYAQFGVIDAAAPQLAALSEGLQTDFCQ
jgi:hypothetical protein